jgi:hypothetical protein
MSSPTDETVPHITHDEFRTGLPHGRFRVVIDPKLARGYVMQLTRINALAIVLIGVGAAIALGGQGMAGLALVLLGVVLNRLTRSRAGPILLYLAQRNAAVYRDATEGGIMEVRRAA